MALTNRTRSTTSLAKPQMLLLIVLLAIVAPVLMHSSRISHHITHRGRMLLQDSQSSPTAPLLPQIFILSCPGNPGCPGEPPITASPAAPATPSPNNSSSEPPASSSTNTSASPGSQSPNSSASANTTTPSPPAQTPPSPNAPSSASGTTSPAPGMSGPSYNTSNPAQPDPPRPDELLPEELLRLLATSSGQLQPDAITISLAVEGVSPVDFNYRYKALLISITAATTGTKGYSWNLNFQQQQATQTGRRLLQYGAATAGIDHNMKWSVYNSRHMLQQPPVLQPSNQQPPQQQQQPNGASAPSIQGDDILVSLSIYTINPQLVWYRLTKPPTQIPADGANTTGCSTEYCVALLVSGIPMLSNSIQITPSYTNVLRGNIRDGTTLDAIAAQIQANRLLLDNARQYIGYVVGPLMAVLVLLLLWCQRQRIAAWIRPKSKRQAASRSNKWRTDTDSSSISTDSDEARDADPRDLAIVPHRPKHTRKKSSRSPSVSSPRSTVTVASSSSRASSGAAMAGRSTTPWALALARGGDDSASSVRSEDLDVNGPIERMSVADGASENGSAITIRDFITENPQQRWQQPQQWSKNLTALEKDVIERYFGRMQQSVEMMHKPSTASQGRPESEAADHDEYDDRRSDDNY